MIDLLRTVLLENTSGGHDKFYYIEIKNDHGRYVVTRSWGRRPFAHGKGQSASETFTTYFAAQMSYHDRMTQKGAKGYLVAHEWEKSTAPVAVNTGKEVFGF